MVVQRWRPSPSVRVAPAPTAGSSSQDTEVTDGTRDQLLSQTFRDDFDRDVLGKDWFSTSNQWHLQSGELCTQSTRNHPVWLKRRLPANVRLSFNARALSSGADLKFEAWGNGRSHASGSTYDDATGYILIFGGWNNRFHVLARFDEHAAARQQLRLDPSASAPKLAPVEANKKYRFELERRDGKTLVWSVDGTELFRFSDKDPLRGAEHDHFGFNDWESQVCFDDLTIIPLPE